VSKRSKKAPLAVSRRELLKLSALGALVAQLPIGWRGRVYASDAPEMSSIRIGIIALTDCSSIVIGREKGFFKTEGLDEIGRASCRERV